MKRQKFLKDLRLLIPKYGSDNIVYLDESGFEPNTYRDQGWALRGKKTYVNVTEKRERRTNLIMAQRGRRGKDWLAPMLFQGACSASTVEVWVCKYRRRILNSGVSSYLHKVLLKLCRSMR